ncbi:MAG: hypothetical protein ACQEXX_29655 [Bacillota bacterium]
MKLKKLFSILIISASLMTISQSAFADATNVNTNDFVVPTVAGLGDTKDQAIDIFDRQEYNLFLQSANDEDWFKWTNNTGQGRFTYGHLYNRGPENVISTGVVIKYNDTKESTMLMTQPTSKGNTTNSSTFLNVYVPEGATLYMRVKANEFVNTEQYSFTFGYFNSN